MNKLAISGLVAALGIGLGAFGAHGLESVLIENGRTNTWETAVLYHLVHAVALFALACSGDRVRGVWAFRLWLIGALLFSGSLYVLSLTNLSLLGAITPFGGLAFLAGWIAVILENRRV